jgi:hypothetical protein
MLLSTHPPPHGRSTRHAWGDTQLHTHQTKTNPTVRANVKVVVAESEHLRDAPPVVLALAQYREPHGRDAEA